MAWGWQGSPYFWRYRRELVIKTGDFVKEKLGGIPKNDSTAGVRYGKICYSAV